MTRKTDKMLEWIFLFGRPLSPLYACLMANRSRLYRKGVFRRLQLEIPVVSVGNLVLGGTGKTPLVHHIAKLLSRHNRQPAILSRGYKGTAKSPINVVSDRRNILLDAARAGDEPRLLAEKLPGVPVITGKKRFATGRFAIDSLGADCLILDDGFQHLALKRDMDLVLFSARKLLGNGRVLPGGELREPLSALQRADAFIISGANPDPGREVEQFIGFLNRRFPGKPVFMGTFQPGEVLPRIFQGTKDTTTLAACRDIPLYGFCGIAQPGSFQAILQNAGLNITGFQAFDDHHPYAKDTLQSLLDRGIQSGAHAMITTEKDLVKLRNLFPHRALPLLALPIQLTMGPDFDQYLLSRLNIETAHPPV